MALQRFSRPTPLRDRPEIAVYGGLFVLVLVSDLLDLLVARVVDAVETVDPSALGPRVLGAVLYASLGLAVLAAVVTLYRRHGDPGRRLDRQELVSMGGAAALLLLVAGYAVQRLEGVPVVPRPVLAPALTGGVAMALPALVYARLRGSALRLSPSGRASLVLAAETVVAVLLVVAVPVATLVVTEPTVVGSPSGIGFGPTFSPGWLLWDVVVPALFVGVGMAVLVNAAVQERLREFAGGERSVAAVTALFGFDTWASLASLYAEPVAIVGTVAGVVAVAVLAALLAASVAGRLLPRVDGWQTVTAAVIGVGVTAVAPLLSLAAGATLWPTTVVASLSYAAVGAVAAVAYERTRSVWMSALAFVTSLVADDLARIVLTTLP